MNLNKKKLTTEEKLQLMIDYINETGDIITLNTKYKGYNIGFWKNNWQQTYYNGSNKMNKELLDTCIKYGIIRQERARKEKTSNEEKIIFLMGLVGKSKSEIKSARMKNGLTFLQVRQELQAQYKRGKLKSEQIETLKNAGFLNPTNKEKKQIISQSSFPKKDAVKIISKYGSEDEFVKKYKMRKTDYKFSRNLFSGFRGIVLSENDMTEEQKLGYGKLAEAIIGENDIPLTTYIDADKLEEVLSFLDEDESAIITMFYGLDGNKLSLDECGKIFNCTGSWIGQTKDRTIEKIREYNIRIDFLTDIGQDKSKLEILTSLLNWNNVNISSLNLIRQYITDNKGNEEKYNKKISELGVPKAVYTGVFEEDFSINDLISKLADKCADFKKEVNMLDLPISSLKLSYIARNYLPKQGITTIRELTELSQNDLMKMRGVRHKKIGIIEKALKDKGLRLRANSESFNELNSIKDNEFKRKIEEYEHNRQRLGIEELFKMIEHEVGKHCQEAEIVKARIDEISERIERYNIAYKYYISVEDIFNAKSIVPAIPRKNKIKHRKRAKTLEKIIRKQIKRKQEILAELMKINENGDERGK